MNKRIVIGVAASLVAACMLAWSSASAAHDGEHHTPGDNGQPDGAELSAMTATPCVNGLAFTFPCNRIDLAALLPVQDVDGTADAGVTANEVWGWTDPQTGKEYAILGLSNGVAFVDVSNPESPVYLGNLPTHAIDPPRQLWRSLKVYRNHVFVVSEVTNHGMQVFDLTRLRNVASPPQVFTETAHYDRFGSAHTLAVNEETGFVYAAGSRPAANGTPNVNTCPGATATRGGGLHIVDVRNPAAPAFAGCVNEDGYTHETQCVIYRGPDAQHRDREICFNANEDTVTIVDVTNKAAPVQLSRTTYEGAAYTHQGWLTEDHRTLLVNDELDEKGRPNPQTKTLIFDVTDLDAPMLRNVQLLGNTAIDHNLYVRGRYVFESNYRSGLRILDAANANAGTLTEVAFFDVFPANDLPEFNGSWHNYPYFASGTILVSGIEQGLFVLRPTINLPVRIDYTPYFVRQHYLDFLAREPDEPGLAFWSHGIAACVADEACTEVRRINVSTAFFVSIEFLNTGFLVHRFHAATFPNSLPQFQPFTADLRKIKEGVVVGAPGWEQKLEANKQAFALEWAQRPEFLAQLPADMTASDYVGALFNNAGANPTQAERDAAIAAFGAGGTEGRARALRSVADSGSVYNRQYNRAFVLMQYFGYLRRDPDPEGFQFWLDKLNSFTNPGEDVRDEQTALQRIGRAEMVRAFISSIEYRARFGNN